MLCADFRLRGNGDTHFNRGDDLVDLVDRYRERGHDHDHVSQRAQPHAFGQCMFANA